MAGDLRERLLAAFRWVDLGPAEAYEVSDASGWWRDGGLLADLGPALAALFVPGPPAAPHPTAPPTVVVGPETSGFLVGPLVARALGIGFVEAYKGDRGHVADRMLRRTTEPDYRGRVVTLSLRARLIDPADRVLVVDDWVATGAQLATLRDLVGDAGATYLGAAVVVDGCPPARTAELGIRGLLSRGDLDAIG